MKDKYLCLYQKIVTTNVILYTAILNNEIVISGPNMSGNTVTYHVVDTVEEAILLQKRYVDIAINNNANVHMQKKAIVNKNKGKFETETLDCTNEVIIIPLYDSVEEFTTECLYN